jgi:D-xylose transport system permease protein
VSDTAKHAKSDLKSPVPGSAADPTAAAIPTVDPRLLVREEGLRGYLTEFKRKVRGGELGSLPVIVGLVVIAIVFQSMNSEFLSANSINSIAIYTAVYGVMSIGVVFVLLLGEIDLAIGSVAGLSAATWAVLSTRHGMSDWLAVAVALLVGIAVGVIHGFFFAKIGVPAFVVTLAGNLGWMGLQIKLMGSEGTINTPDGSFVDKLTNTYFSNVAAAYTLAIVAVALYALSQVLDRRRRVRVGLTARPFGEIIVRTVGLAIVTLVVAYELNQSRGLPLGLVIFVAILVVADFVVRRTTYGRQVFAVGGGIEAARRAGISVPMVRITVFAISGLLAAFGGLYIASLSGGADKALGSGNVLMNVIAAAVIGGTSLFGGRGKIWSALLGTLVIEAITQGLNLQGMAAEIQYMITGAVLLAAVVIDSVSRRTQKSSGRG